jgi:hypothetical protein
MSKVVIGAVCVVTAISLTACGSSGPSANDTATASLKAELLQQSASSASPFTFSDSQAQCAASRVVTSVGTSALQHYGLLNAENKATSKTLDSSTLSTGDATAVVNAIVDCLGSANFSKALTDAVSKNIKGTKTAAQRACLEGKLTVAVLKPMLISTLSGDQSAAGTFAQNLASCMTGTK